MFLTIFACQFINVIAQLGMMNHDHGLLVHVFGNLCTSIYQCDSAIWGDNNVGSMSLITCSHQDVPLLDETI
jgi:hypothetical protein